MSYRTVRILLNSTTSADLIFAGIEDSQLLHPVDENDEDMQLEDVKEVDT